METRAYVSIAAILGLALTVLSLIMYSQDDLNGYMPDSEYVHSQIPQP